MKIVTIALLIIAYISAVVEGFIHSISEGLLRLALCSLCLAILLPLFLLNDDNKFDDKSDDDY